MEIVNESKQTQVIEAPSREFEPREFRLFLAGGITNCPDWQQDFISRMASNPNLSIFNPRRKEFPIHDPEAAEEQIKWEYDHLKDANMIVVWFSRGSLNPIVLYELGRWVNSRPELPSFVGIDPEYERAQDVIIQTRLARPDIRVARSIDELVEGVERYLGGEK
jgi:hypothetical protein